MGVFDNLFQFYKKPPNKAAQKKLGKGGKHKLRTTVEGKNVQELVEGHLDCPLTEAVYKEEGRNTVRWYNPLNGRTLIVKGPKCLSQDDSDENRNRSQGVYNPNLAGKYVERSNFRINEEGKEEWVIECNEEGLDGKGRVTEIPYSDPDLVDDMITNMKTRYRHWRYKTIDEEETDK